MSDVDAVLKAVLDAERTSIRTFKALYDQLRKRDPITEQLIAELLASAVEGEEELEKLLGDSAPEMDGK